MQLFETLDNDNFVMYAMKNYDNPQCADIEEFNEDLQRFKYLKRLFNRYDNGDLQERLILNHLIVIYNVFGVEAANRMVFYKCDRNHWSVLKTFLIYLGYLQEDALVDTPLDQHVVDVLRNI
jgi:hypothetical protein